MNRVKIAEGMRSFNRKAKEAGLPKMTLERLAPLVFGENEGITGPTGLRYLSRWNTGLDAETSESRVSRPHPRHLVRIARALGVSNVDQLLEE